MGVGLRPGAKAPEAPPTLVGTLDPGGRRHPEKVLAAHRCGLARVILPRQNRKQVDEEFVDNLRREHPS